MLKAWARLRRLILRACGWHGPLKSFSNEVREGSGLLGSAALGIREVQTDRIVGSVGRARELRSDFFYRRRNAVTQRYRRIEAAMKDGKLLPPVELYKVHRTDRQGAQDRVSEYYVLDGHHRVAMARKLGQAYLDAHVVEYRLAGTDSRCSETPSEAE